MAIPAQESRRLNSTPRRRDAGTPSVSFLRVPPKAGWRAEEDFRGFSPGAPLLIDTAALWGGSGLVASVLCAIAATELRLFYVLGPESDPEEVGWQAAQPGPAIDEPYGPGR
jgi:hypothetical protein